MEKNVADFIDVAAKIVGRAEEDSFSQNVSTDHEDLIKSPIERIVYCAIRALGKINFVTDAEPYELDGKWISLGLNIIPQYKVGNYRADFWVAREWIGFENGNGVQRSCSILVECDSQQFHERTERERRYEKQRDRYFTAQGFKTLHFTGSEITNTPWLVAAEILDAVNAGPKQGLLDSLTNYVD